MKPRSFRVRGLGLVELMVGLVLGMFAVAAATGLLLGQLRELHHRLLDTRLLQETRGALALVEHDLHRAAGWGDAATGAWAGNGAPQPPSNPYAAWASAAGTAGWLGFSYSRDSTENQQVDGNERFGLRLQAASGTLEWRLSGAALAPGSGDNWQALNDPQTVRIAELSVTPATQVLSLADRCTLPCPTAGSDCPPQLLVRSVRVAIAASATAQPAVQTRQDRSLLVPNDAVQGRCPI